MHRAASASGGWVLASETCALDLLGARFIRDVEPGELVTIDETGSTSDRFAEAKPAACVFEHVYFARPDSTLMGQNVYATRYRMGERLAEESPVNAELVMPVPDSGVPAAQGFAQASGIPYGEGFVKNRYVGRTFIQPTQSMRQQGIRMKLNPLREVIAGQARGRGRRLDRARQHHASRSLRCCARPAPARSTCASRRHRSSGPASTGSTCRIRTS